MPAKKRSGQTSYLGLALIMVGIAIITSTIIIWLLLRGPDQLAVRNLPTPSSPPTVAAVAQDPAAADNNALAAPTSIPPTPLATVPVIPTAELQALPSEASMLSAPTSMRETVPGQPQRIQIPSIGVDAPVRDVGLSAVYDASQGADLFYQWQVPQYYAAGWHHNSAPLGQTGNTVLNGHQNVFGEVFRDLEDLEIGDGIIMYDENGSHLYEITNKEFLLERGQSAEAREINAQWIQTTADERITLVTCWPYTDNSHRLVIVAKPVQLSMSNP